MAKMDKNNDNMGDEEVFLIKNWAHLSKGQKNILIEIGVRPES